MTGRFGAKNVKKWKFETWNEPDLKGYNREGFDLAGEHFASDLKFRVWSVDCQFQESMKMFESFDVNEGLWP